MPRTAINLGPHKDEIIQLFRDGMSSRNIAAHIRERHGISAAERTIKDISGSDIGPLFWPRVVRPRTTKARMQEWRVRKRNRTLNTDSALRDRVKTLFSERGLEDREILRFLQDEGFEITLRSLGRLRRGLNLNRGNPEQAEQRHKKEELTKGIIKGYGKELLYRHFRDLGVIVSLNDQPRQLCNPAEINGIPRFVIALSPPKDRAPGKYGRNGTPDYPLLL